MHRILSFLVSLALFFMLVVAHDAAAAVKNSEVDGSHFGTQDMICHGSDNCYPRVFVPTKEFQIVKDDQILPPGLHVKINLETSLREAKIPDDDDDTVAHTYDVAIPKENIDGASMAVTVPPESGEVKEQEVTNPKTENLKPNPKISQDDRTRFNSAVETINSKSTDGLDEALPILAEVTHEIEYGVEVMKASTVEKLLGILNPTGSFPKKLREDAAVIIGNALQNNPNAIDKASRLVSSKNRERLNIVSHLLRNVVDERDAVVQKRIMFALARAIRIPGAREDFVNRDGLETLRILFSKNADPALRGKIAAFVEDEFLNPDMVDDAERKPFKVGQPNKDRVVSIVNVPQELVKWCPTLQKSLPSGDKDADMAEKVLRTLTLIKTRYGAECKREDSIIPWLDSHLKTAGDPDEEDDGFVVVMKDAKKAFS